MDSRINATGFTIGRRFCLVCIAALLAISTGYTNAQTPPKRIPLPDTAAQKRVEKLINEVYADEIKAARTDAKRVELAVKLMKAADDSTNDRAEQFGLLKAARVYATAALNIEQTLAATRRLTETFDCDASAWMDDSLGSLAHTNNPEDARSLLRVLRFEIDQAKDDGDLPRAERLANLAVTVAKATGSHAIETRESHSLQQIQDAVKANADLQKCLADLQSNPGDPKLNLAAGTMYAGRNQWSLATHLLALSGKPELKAAAVLEASAPADPLAQLMLADTWMAAAEGQSKALSRAIQLRAAMWYRVAEPRLTGLQKVKANHQLDACDLALPFRAQPTEYSLGGDQSQLMIMPADAGFCVLGSVTGHFEGYGEHEWTEISTDGAWTANSHSNIGKMTPRFIDYNTAPDRSYHSKVSFFKWSRGEPKVKMIRKEEGFCFLSGVTGHFAGIGEYVEITFGKDGYWYLGGGSGQDQLSATAVAVRFADPKLVAGEAKSFLWNVGDPPVRLIPEDAGICALVGIGGRFGADGDQAGLRLGDDGFWILDGQCGSNKDLWVRAAVLKYPGEKD